MQRHFVREHIKIAKRMQKLDFNCFLKGHRSELFPMLFGGNAIGYLESLGFRVWQKRPLGQWSAKRFVNGY
jgi:hypothetical protein